MSVILETILVGNFDDDQDNTEGARSAFQKVNSNFVLVNAALSGTGNKNSVDTGETLTIPDDYSYIVFGHFTANGTVNPQGKLVVL